MYKSLVVFVAIYVIIGVAFCLIENWINFIKIRKDAAAMNEWMCNIEEMSPIDVIVYLITDSLTWPYGLYLIIAHLCVRLLLKIIGTDED